MQRHTSLQATSRTSRLPVPATAAWRAVASGLEGRRWYVDARPFVFRGAVDRLIGGAGRRWPVPGTPLLATGDVAGFWRVLDADHDRRRLVLEAAVRAPGRVLLTTTVTPVTADACELHQTVAFEPRGLLGAAYLLTDLPARELLLEVVHRRTAAEAVS